MTEKWCDVVLEGGGVKGIGLVGALAVLDKQGYRRCRMAGTSAGAIVGALVAAGMAPEKLTTVMQTLDYTKFRDEGFVDRLNLPGKTASFVFEKGIYEGEYLRNWLKDELEKLGVRTFADLRLDENEDWVTDLPEEQRYKLVVIASDVTNGRMVRFPWDYKLYGLDPNQQLVADAVRASMSIPFFYEPAKLNGNYLVDGGMLSNFPIDIFDNTNEWPTFGIKLSAKPEANQAINPVGNALEYSLAIWSTILSGHDQMHIDDPCAQARTMFVDTFDIKATNFDITADMQAKLHDSGVAQATKFFKTWDFKKFQKQCPTK